MIHIAIVEDDERTRKQLSTYIRHFYEGNESLYSITEYADGDDILADCSSGFDLILLDIQMPRIDGMRTAEAIRKLDEDVCLVFVTNLGNYAIQGYAVNATDFILKPVNELMLAAVLKKVEKILSRRKKHYVMLPTDRGLARLDIGTISYAEASGHQMVIHADSGEYRLRSTVGELETQLQGGDLFRCNSGLLVNLRRVQNVHHSNVTVGDVTLPISRSRYREFMDALSGSLENEEV